MARMTLAQDGRARRTKILPGGLRVRAARPDETKEQRAAWSDGLLQRGFAGIVFNDQWMLDIYVERCEAGMKREALRDKLERQFLCGELQIKKAPRAAVTL